MSCGWAKRIIVSLVIGTGHTGLLSAQNLVLNPGFEVLKRPVCEFLMYNYVDSTAENVSDYIQDWYAPTGGTTDPWFYSDTLDKGSTPSKLCTQNLKRFNTTTHSGRSCIGLANSVASQTGSPSAPYREYIQTRLQKPLRRGVIYNVEYYVQRSPEAGTASNNINLLFSTAVVTLVEHNPRSFGNLIARQPQIVQQQIIRNSGQWTKVSDCFRADSAYQYITIGNFSDDQHTEFLTFPNYGNRTTLCYYLIDDVSVTESAASELPPVVRLGRDTTLCPNVSVEINLPIQSGIRYRWQDGDTTARYKIHQSGVYWVAASVGTCVHSDTIKVLYEKPLSLPPDTTICSEEPFWLRAGGPPGSFLWSDSTQQDSLLVRQTGLYWVKNIHSVCALSDTIQVQVVDCPGQIPNVFTPNGDGKNDSFFIKNTQYMTWRLQITNRWGRQVYDAEPYRNQWDGEGLPAGLYYYYLSSQRINRSYKGWVEVLR